MSEFNETCHLEAETQQAGVELLRTAGAKGFVLPPENGWVTIVPGAGEPVGPITRLAEGALLHVLNADDRGWMFELFVDGIPVSSYMCRWDGGLMIDDRRLELDPIVELAARRGHDSQTVRSDLERILHPSEQYIFEDEQAENPAYLFAELVGLVDRSLEPPREPRSEAATVDTADVARLARLG